MEVGMQVSKQVFGSLMGLSLGLVMSLVMSFVMLVTQVGFIDGFVLAWLQGSAAAFIISAPVGLIAAPLIERFLRRLFCVAEG
jgi:hypothetical protein